MFVRAAAERYAERRHHGVVKAARSGNVPNNELNMIDQAATIERLSVHEASPPFPTGEPSAGLQVSCPGPLRASRRACGGSFLMPLRELVSLSVAVGPTYLPLMDVHPAT